MIYEKTLTRKMIGIPPSPQREESSIEGVIEDGEMHAEPPKRYSKMLWEKLRGIFITPFQSRRKLFKQDQNIEETKQPASMGKILNLMR